MRTPRLVEPLVAALALIASFIGVALCALPAVLLIGRPAWTEDQESGGPDVSYYNLNPFHVSRGYVLGRIWQAERERPFGGALGAIAGIVYSPLVAQVRLGTSVMEVKVQDDACFASKSAEAENIPNAFQKEAALQAARDRCSHTITPFLFKTNNTEIESQVYRSMGSTVLLSYVESRIVIATDVDATVEKIWPIDPGRRLPRSYWDRIDHFPVSSWLHAERGSIEGRVVKAAVEGNIRESYAVTVEVGTTGNVFQDMNIATSDLYDFVIECMLTNRPLRLFYLDLTSIAELLPDLLRGYRTPYRIYRVEARGGEGDK
jgi:hypothetical protein